MGLSQSLYTGFSGLYTHQKSMDNIGNNLANINTVGYKKSEFMFDSLFKEAISGSMPADANRSATNPKNVGMGVTTGAILTNFQTSAPEQTGNPLDCAITGNGFFVVSTPNGTALTRNGSFYLDVTSNPNERILCAGNGYQVQGWNAVNGVVTPSQTVGDIYVPARGDRLEGQVTDEIELTGVLPTNTSTSDFAGASTNLLELKGNLPDGESSLTTQIYMPVTQTGGDNPVKDDVQAVTVRIDFTGPEKSSDGLTDSYSWTMTTVDWPEAGSPGIQIYPTENGTQEAVNFYSQGSVTNGNGAGEAKSSLLNPGSTKIESVQSGEDGDVVTSFSLPADFAIDVSRLTHVANAPGGNSLETWYVNGNPTGTLALSVDVLDEYTAFEAVTDANGTTTMQAIRSVDTRRNTMLFSRESQDNTGSVWSWQSTFGGDGGQLTFDTNGALTASQQSGGSITYDFSAMQSVNQEATLGMRSQNGYKDGFMDSYTIDANGRIIAHYDNNVDVTVAQIALATVPNTSGLASMAGTLFYTSAASGDIMIGVAGDASEDFGIPAIGAGALATQALESSNVNLAQEFSSMIAIERGYQFQSRIITTSNEMLQTALQLKS